MSQTCCRRKPALLEHIFRGLDQALCSNVNHCQPFFQASHSYNIALIMKLFKICSKDFHLHNYFFHTNAWTRVKHIIFSEHPVIFPSSLKSILTIHFNMAQCFPCICTLLPNELLYHQYHCIICIL